MAFRHEVLHIRRQKQRLIDIPGAKILAHSPRLNQTRPELNSDYSDRLLVGGHGNGIASKSAEPRAAATHWVAGAVDRFEAAHELADRHLGLHPRQRITGASVDAEAEGEVTVGM